MSVCVCLLVGERECVGVGVCVCGRFTVIQLRFFSGQTIFQLFYVVNSLVTKSELC